MAIKQPTALATGDKKIRLLIAGYPGIGKSTVGLSAPAPLHIDVDRGLDRVEAMYRKDFIQPDTYDELLEDLVPANLGDYETLVFDTGGQLIKLMSVWAIKQNPKNGQTDGTLSLKGYGAIGREFERLMNYCYNELRKHIVVLFHAKEEKDGDTNRLRLLVEGQTKDNVWQPMDLGGYMEMQGKNRTIGFTNCERYYAKGTHGINGVIPVPELKADMPNDFLAKLFALVNDNISREVHAAIDVQILYEEVMTAANNIINGIDTPEAATKAIDAMQGLKHVLTSEKEAKSLFAKKIRTMNYTFDKESGAYVA